MKRPASHARWILPLLALATATGCDRSRRVFDPAVVARSDAFADHTVPRIDSEETFARLARQDGLLAGVKFVITDFNDPTRRALRFYDSKFYALHDEWFWFRLLNGALVPGDDTSPLAGHSFATIADVYAWARGRMEYPLDLEMYPDGRLYSPRFYRECFGRDRRFGVGSLMKLPPAPGETQPRWAFELEFSDEVQRGELQRFREMLAPRLPASIARELHFLVRSAPQERLAREIERAGAGERILRYSELVPAGTREVYSAGVAAGYLRLVRAAEGVPATNSEQIVVFEHLPDLLPPAAGIVTAVPQTPLAHINLLARNRGIPNALLANALEDPLLSQLARGYAPVLLVAEAPATVRVMALEPDEYARYRALVQRPMRLVETPAPESIPYVIELSRRRPTEMLSLSPTIGGKAMGFVALAAAQGISIPDSPLSITARAYVEHIDPMRERIEQLLAEPAFDNDARVRELALEGRAKYLSRHPAPTDRAFVEQFFAPLGASTRLLELARGDGLRGMIERAPIAPTTLAQIRAELARAYAHLAPSQGLRFRSSSNVEDIEGFNGAGLYESFTGFLDPSASANPRDRDKTIERAIRKVWGSFWGFEAFEERRAERIDHEGAAMAVLVHPRFDDPLERATGVCTLTILPPTSEDSTALTVNVQRGAESVANPDGATLPEVLRVIARRSDGALRVERARRSTLSPNEDLLGDEQARALFAQTAPIATAWLERENASLSRARRARSLTLDFEFHDMRAGWPARRDGVVSPARMVLKQVRTLEPGGRVTVEGAERWPVPREVLARARRVTRERCEAELPRGAVTIERLRVQTDRSIAPDVGYADRPLDVELRVTLSSASAMGLGSRDDVRIEHTELSVRAADGAIEYAPSASAGAGFDRLTLRADGTVELARGSNAHRGALRCRTETLFASPRDYLLSLAAERDARTR